MNICLTKNQKITEAEFKSLRRGAGRSRYNLWLKEPNCFWCGCETVFIVSHKNEGPPDNMATIDHINNRFNKNDRLKPNYVSEKRRINSCYKCNNLRGTKEYAYFKNTNKAAIVHPLTGAVLTLGYFHKLFDKGENTATLIA